MICLLEGITFVITNIRSFAVFKFANEGDQREIDEGKRYFYVSVLFQVLSLIGLMKTQRRALCFHIISTARNKVWKEIIIANRKRVIKLSASKINCSVGWEMNFDPSSVWFYVINIYEQCSIHIQKSSAEEIVAKKSGSIAVVAFDSCCHTEFKSATVI